jgi:hypothetical protein
MSIATSRTETPIETAAMPRRKGTYRIVARRIDHLRDNLTDRAERTMREVKRTARRGRYALEDAAGFARLGVRRYPGKSVAIAFLAGSAVTLAAALLLRRRFRS